MPGPKMKERITMEKAFELWDNQNKRKITVEAKKVGQEWKAFCPFHDDRKTPNLSINEDKKVYYCFVCGAKGHLFESGFMNPERTIIDIYNYEDESGKLIYQVLKYDKTKKGSKFLQRRPNGKGGFIWNLQGIELLPYNLPELAIKSEKIIFVVEGEKDCKSLEKLGLLATTNSGGAGKWKNDYNKWFKNRDVIVIPDNDKPGMDHASDIVKALKPVAKSIKRLTLPGLEKGEDVSDWINNGGNLEKLHKIMLDTPIISNQEEEKDNNIISAYDLLKSDIPPEPMLISRGLLPASGYLLIGAYTKEGKTLLSLQMTLNLISGTHFLDEFKVTKKCKVLYIYGENTEAGLKELLQRQLEGLKEQDIFINENDLLNLDYYNGKELIMDKEGIELLGEKINNDKYDVIFLDPIGRFINFDINKGENVLKMIKSVDKIAQCAWVFIHHFRKPSEKGEIEPIYRLMGSSNLANYCESFMGLEHAGKKRPDNYKKVTFKLRRESEPLPLYLHRDINKLTYDVIDPGEMELKTEATIQDIIRIWNDSNLPDKASYKNITDLCSDRLGVTKQRIAKLLREGRADNIFDKEPGKRGKWYVSKDKLPF